MGDSLSPQVWEVVSVRTDQEVMRGQFSSSEVLTG